MYIIHRIMNRIYKNYKIKSSDTGDDYGDEINGREEGMI